ncbi:Uncharacterised protein [Vibrio cholerae]|nr:Uncharacterised protein [Vibrio cholerae]
MQKARSCRENPAATLALETGIVPKVRRRC